jgi:(p)ppGpp synthase/HD superfamily hydrolase
LFPVTAGRRLLHDAIDIAVRAHSGQLDKLGEPYIGHPVRVMERVAGDEAKMVAVLHDVLEDTSVTPAELRDAGIPDHVVAAVDVLTKRPGERYEAFVRRVRESGDRLAIVVKRADIDDNIDPSRMKRLPSDTRSRLERKYATGLAILDGRD